MEQYRRTVGKWLSGSALLCLALAACNKTPQADQPVTGAPVAALELATAPPPPPSYAPTASALPPAPRPVAYRPSPEHWRYLTDAYDMSDAFADTPPDYTVDYEGEDPYIWRADDGAYRVVEWLPDGARYYYYEPGADEPFLIQDPDYSYAYDNGALVAVYTLAGALVAEQIADERRGYAARYYARGHDLYRAAVNDRRRAAYAGDWQNRAPMIRTQRTRWQQGRQEQPGWRDWNQAHQAQQEARWAPERQHRATYAAALGAAGVAGAAYVAHQRDRQAAEHDALRPASQQPVNALGRPVPGPDHNRPDIAERHAEADRAQPGLLHSDVPAPRGHVQHPAVAERHGPQQPPARDEAAHQAMAQAQQAQRHEQQQAQKTQRHEVMQAQQAQHREAAQAAQAQRHEAQQAQQAQQAQRAEAQARMQQAHQAQRAGMQAQHAQAQQLRQQSQAEAHAAPPAHVETPRPQPQAQPRAAAPHPQTPHPVPQPHDNGHGGGHQDDRHPHQG